MYETLTRLNGGAWTFFLPGTFLLALAAVFPVPMAAQDAELTALELYLAENVLEVVPSEERLADLQAQVAARIERDEREIDSLRATGEWDRLSESDRAFFETREPPTLAEYVRMMEVPAGIGTLSFAASGGRPRLNPWPWSVERGAHGLTVVVAVGEGEQDRAEVLFFDGDTLRLRPSDRAGAEDMVFSAVADISPSGREADTRLLVGEWHLVQVDEQTLEDYPTLTYSFRSNGTFEIEAADGPAGATTEIVGTPPEGSWALSISRPDYTTINSDFEMETITGRLLALASPEPWSQLFTVTRLDEHTLVLRPHRMQAGQGLRFER